MEKCRYPGVGLAIVRIQNLATDEGPFLGPVDNVVTLARPYILLNDVPIDGSTWGYCEECGFGWDIVGLAGLPVDFVAEPMEPVEVVGF
jgi:hypothetical protein